VGRPGVGKTTIIQSIVAHLGRRAGGFYTEEVREHGRRTAFRLVALDGPTGILASVSSSSRHRVGRYGVHLDDLEEVGVTALRRAIEEPHIWVVVIDEIGKMELFSPAFRQAVEAALSSPKQVLATVMAGRHPWVDDIKARAGVDLMEITLEHRQTIPDRILRWLNRCRGEISLLDV
jgi:nucleoside-triphosphatase